MTTNRPARFRICVLPGDGIGPEIMNPCLHALNRVTDFVGGYELDCSEAAAGAACYQSEGEALPASTMAAARDADAILLAAMGDPAVRYPDGTEIAPQLDLRFQLGLFAGVRPVRSISGVAGPLSDPRAHALDFVLIRESTEGFFTSRGRGEVTAEEARDTQVITRAGSERLFRFSFDLALRRKRHGSPGIVTLVDKANVFKSFAFFREVFDEIAHEYPDIEARHAYVDATALDLVRRPWIFDVLVTENMFGDILSDLGAGLIGGMGMAPSADIGTDHAVFQPCHGSAPDIAGKGLANPAAMVLSGAMMLQWLGEKHGVAEAGTAASLLTRAVDDAFAGGLASVEVGGSDGTATIAAAIDKALTTLMDRSAA